MAYDLSTIDVKDGMVQTGRNGEEVNLNFLSEDGYKNAQIAKFIKSSPTVVTDANIREKVIPETISKANQTLPPPVVQQPSQAQPDQSKTSASSSTNYGDIYTDLAKSLGITDPSGDTDSKAELDLLDKMHASADALSASHIADIKQKYADKANLLKESEKAISGGLQHALIAGGISRRTPGAAASLMSAKDKADVRSLSDLESQERTAVAAAETARSNKDYQTLQSQLNVVQKARAAKVSLAKTIASKVATENKKLQDTQIKSSRDNAIVGIINQGITDPSEILKYLNFDEQGNPTGDFTSKEVSATLKAVAPGGDLAGLSGQVKNFFALKGKGELPNNIESLPEEQQLTSYLATVHAAQTTGKGGKKITQAEAKSLGLPLSIIGQSENDVVGSFSKTQVPEWFKEKLKGEGGDPKASTTPALWNNYRIKVQQGFTAAKKSSSTTAPANPYSK